MNDENITGLIDYLLKRQFGSLAPPPGPTLGVPSSFRSNAAAEDSYKPIHSKRAEYQKMDADELRSLAKKAQREDADARSAKLKAETARLFFNLPHATADFDYWSKMPTWKLDEAIALSLGKNPSVVNWRSVSMDGERFIPEAFTYSPFPREYARRREFVNRANTAYDLDEPIKPAAFLTWAKHIEMSCPPELEAAVAKRAPIPDLRRDLETARARIAELETLVAAACDDAAHHWPWGDYETDRLRTLAAAAQKFWANYDPADPSTAVTNSTVITWLIAQGESTRVAEIMAQILRADGLRTGPR